MEKVSDKCNFQIILKSNNEEDFSNYWQAQCHHLYNGISMALPEGMIKPLTLEGDENERNDGVTLFHVLEVLITEITVKFFVDVVMEEIKNWHSYRPSAEILLKCPGGQIFKITKQSIPKLQKYFDENYRENT